MPKSPDRRPLRRPVAAAWFGLCVIVVAGLFAFYAWAEVRSRMLRAMSFLVALPSQPGTGEATASVARKALLLEPLSQHLFNAVATDRAHRAGAKILTRPDAAVLRRLGWRDTPALQNLLLSDLNDEAYERLIDVADALLRRNQLIEPTRAILANTEVDDVWQARIVAKLLARPAWRLYYLQNGAELRNPAVIRARGETMLEMQRRGAKLSSAEINSVLPNLIDHGLAPAAYAIWRGSFGVAERPLADPAFRRLARQSASTDPSVFLWQVGIGADFDVQTGNKDRGGLTIRWNGRGTPIFVTQRSSGPPGRYTAELATVDGKRLASGQIGLRLMCPGEAIDFRPTGSTRDGGLRLESEGPVPCGFARLELYGIVQDRPADILVDVAHIELRAAAGHASSPGV